VSTRSKPPVAPGPRLLRISEVARWLGVSRTAIYNWSRNGFFPKPVILGPQHLKSSAARWREDEIKEWLDSRPEGRSDDDPA
jgi:predicted DNA-binding transcriptional regulator AlpA